jgi:hypothetical protein
MMCRAANQHSPSFARLQVDMVDLEGGDVVFGVRDSALETEPAQRIAASQDPAGATRRGARWALASMISAGVREILG